MNKILIIKLGALGDVIRTTPLLRVLKGEITWVTQENALPLFKGNPFVQRLLTLRQALSALKNQRYDLVLSLDEEPLACRLAAGLKKGELAGTYQSGDGIAYTGSAAEWFDMSLISKLGKKKADQLKWSNRKSYQEILFGMIGKKFKGEEYVLKSSEKKRGGHPQKINGLVGLETRSGERWIAKRWPHFERFAELLKKNKIPYIKFREFPRLGQFIDYIDQTETVVTTDSLALHIALALRKKVLAIFTVTSPHEIYGYGRTVKVVNPNLKKHYYSTEPVLKAGEKIKPETVFKAFQNLPK